MMAMAQLRECSDTALAELKVFEEELYWPQLRRKEGDSPPLVTLLTNWKVTSAALTSAPPLRGGRA